jgi:hypothetical protein
MAGADLNIFTPVVTPQKLFQVAAMIRLRFVMEQVTFVSQALEGDHVLGDNLQPLVKVIVQFVAEIPMPQRTAGRHNDGQRQGIPERQSEPKGSEQQQDYPSSLST